MCLHFLLHFPIHFVIHFQSDVQPFSTNSNWIGCGKISPFFFKKRICTQAEQDSKFKLPSYIQICPSFTFPSLLVLYLGLSSLASLGLPCLRSACLGSKHNSLTGAKHIKPGACLSCLVLSCLVLSCLVLSCLVFLSMNLFLFVCILFIYFFFLLISHEPFCF